MSTARTSRSNIAAPTIVTTGWMVSPRILSKPRSRSSSRPEGLFPPSPRGARPTPSRLFHDDRRPGQKRSRRRHEPAGRKRHRDGRAHLRTRSQATGVAAPDQVRAPRCLARWSIPNVRVSEANDRELQASATGCRNASSSSRTPVLPGHDLDAGFDKLAAQKIDALVVTADPFFNFRRKQVIALGGAP